MNLRTLERIVRVAGDDFVLKKSATGRRTLPSFEHKAGIEFRLVPAGSFTMGLTKEEEKAATQIASPPPLTISELRPTRIVTLPPFLMSTSPVSIDTVKSVLGSTAVSADGLLEGAFPAYVAREAAIQVTRRLGCRLPSEAEWEYACRAGSTTLFIWGNKLPIDRDLDQWVNMKRKTTKSNAFGLSSLFAGDWCLDEYKPNHKEDSPSLPGAFVIKGGGSVFWPWQGSGEWVWCMPAMRMPSTDLIDGRSAFRLVKSLSENISGL